MQIKACPVMYGELIQLLEYNFNRIDFIDEPVDLGFDCPLDVYCTYTRDQDSGGTGVYAAYICRCGC